MSSELRDSLDRPLRDLRVSVTDRCNFRCSYCMPAEVFGEHYKFIGRQEVLTFEEIQRLVGIMVPLGVRKIRITGGEPLLRHGIHELIRGLKGIPGVEDIALTTNGTLLKRMAGQLQREGLDRMTVSLDSLDPEVFLQTNGGKLSVEEVLEGLEAAERAGFSPIKINCVVQKGVNEDALLDLARYFKGSGHILRFIEFMDVGTRNHWRLEHVVTGAEIVALIGREMPLESVDSNYRGEVARRWRYRDGDGEIGIISSVSDPFCGDCSRARLTTDGRLVTCLFASTGTDLKTPLRDGMNDDGLRELIRGIWLGRSDRYSELRAVASETGRPGEEPRGRVEMYEVGG